MTDVMSLWLAASGTPGHKSLAPPERGGEQ